MEERDALLKARDLLLDVRNIIRDLYAVYEGNGYVYATDDAHEAVGHAYATEDFIESRLTALDKVASR